ncbi:MAG: GAF domain-containing protein, partial [Flavitalea sp.]
MEIKDIVNRKLAVVETCESEPIHVPGSIQPYGCLIALNNETLKVEYCSQNVSDFIGLTPGQLLQQTLPDLLPESWSQIEEGLNTEKSDFPFLLLINETDFEATTYEYGELIIIELEHATNGSEKVSKIFAQTSNFVAIIDKSKNLQDLCQKIAEETRNLTGYDRVMIYRFDKAYNGEVYAESKIASLEPFLSLRYPASDIPAQARELYLRTLVRIISDVNYEPVPILTYTDRSHESLDLSDSQLRSVSPIHVQYLKNMKVGATLTVSLLKEGKLWGLIACHHQTPKVLSYTQRQAVLLQGHFLTSQIRVQEVAEEYRVTVDVEAHLQHLLNKLSAEEEFEHKFSQLTSLLPVANASGVVIVHKGEIFEKGLVPPREKIRQLINWLSENIRSSQFISSFLSQRFPDAISMSRYASGIIFHALGKPKESCIIWFREEVERTVNWAGNPNTAVQKKQDTKSLSPRASFEIWKEKVKYNSLEWRVSEINAASRFASALQGYFYTLNLQEEDFNLRMLNDKLQKANQELSNIN